MKNKKSVMAFSGFFILIFHLWVYVTKSNIEIFVKNTAYIGVDIFFFISAYSLAKNDVKNYKEFVKSRFCSVYVKFIIFVMIQGVYRRYKIFKIFQMITGIELIRFGGKAFLWFIPAIMIYYIIFPVFQRCDKRNKVLTLLILVALWILIAFMGTKYIFGDYAAIIYNRIPVFFLGYYLSKYEVLEKISENKFLQFGLGFMLTAIGDVFLYLWAFKNKLQSPFVGMFYIVVIPACVGLVLLISLIPAKGIIRTIGSCTLEMYAVQMIFGYKIGNILLKKCDNMILNNICIILFVVLLSIFVHFVYDYITKLLKNKIISVKN